MSTEASLVAALLQHPERFHEASHLPQEAFGDYYHGVIYSWIAQRIAEGEPVDLALLGQAHDDPAVTAKAVTLVAEAPYAPENVGSYAESVWQDHRSQRTRQIAARLAESDNPDPAEAISQLMALDDIQGAERVHIRQAAMEAMDELDARYHRHVDGESVGLPTGIKDLDAKLGGLAGGTVTVVAGRPGMGKSALMETMAHYQGKQGYRIAYFTLEMSRTEVIGRMISQATGIDGMRLQRGDMQDDDWPKITHQVPSMASWDVTFIDKSGIGPAEVASHSRAIAHHSGLDAIYIDYLQIMQHPQAERYDISIGQTTSALKRLAKDLDVPVIYGCQLSKEIDKRTDKHPTQGDLRDSSSIEADADKIVFPYREEVYSPDNKDVRGLADLGIGKNRQGATGIVRAVYRPEITLFADYAGGRE